MLTRAELLSNPANYTLPILILIVVIGLIDFVRREIKERRR
jgi:hypothetical protein